MSLSYRALILEAAGGPFRLKQMELPGLKADEAAVRLHAAALNHRDLWIQKGQYAGLKFPVVPGSDGAGVVEKIGSGVDAGWLGRKVVINPSLDWGPSPEAQGKDFRILGLPDPGTFAQYVKVPAANLAPMPAHLSFEEAACLPLAGTTAYRALFTRGRIAPGEKLLVTGIGGGVALFLMRFGLAAKARVFVTSGSGDKLRKAMEMGAEGGVNYKDGNWAEALLEKAGPFDCVIDSAGGPGFPKLCDLSRPGGRLVFFGATAGNPQELPLRKVFWRQLSLSGTTMGSPADFAAMIRYVEDERLKPVIDGVYAFEQADEALRRMDNAGQFGKLVLRMPE
ncbi:MAG TPA: zinc-binding dehydrogenase [Fibrobacteria bacterium]|nr:zinc-binding dehydrogenase [Fibrobacteria bacterium]